MAYDIESRLAVCSWSLQPESPEELASRVSEIGIPRIQLALDSLRENPDIWGKTAELFVDKGIRIVSGMFGTIGEDYSSLDAIKETGGVVPDEHWDANWSNIQVVADIAAGLGLKLITFHAGFLPHEESDPGFAKLLDRITQIADVFDANNIDLGFETGQETADTLRLFLEKLNRPSVGVNFDPANMILYDKGDPIEALETLAPFLKQCHIKDATKTKEPGTWGAEVTVSTGEVDWPAFFATLTKLDYRGDCCIEREADNQRVADIRTAHKFLTQL
ncbi:MAG TPA: sugar phosphate isomerase/epimerase family protein [Verrucomicrobiota bacterium]|jgi:sugar phosphate isomerase/epimerase|nr:sugar phosphate isomerase/epimerase family protein [Verrucomicrobiota bacterium]